MSTRIHKPLCAGETRAKRDYRTGEIVGPPRPCKNTAAAGRDHCFTHEPDAEYKAAATAQRELEQEEDRARRQHRQRLGKADHDKRMATVLEQLRRGRLSVILDPNPHRCPAVGIQDVPCLQNGQYEYCAPELVQCDSYRDHPDGHVHGHPGYFTLWAEA